MDPKRAEATFDEGELAIVVHVEPTHYRMREHRRTAVTLSPAEAAELGAQLLAFAARHTRQVAARESASWRARAPHSAAVETLSSE